MAAFDEKDYTRSFDWSIWKRLTPFVRPFRRDFVGMLVFNGLCALVDVAIPLFQRYAIRNFNLCQRSTPMTRLPRSHVCATWALRRSTSPPV